MIFLAVASPTPGSSISSCLAGGVTIDLGAGRLVGRHLVGRLRRRRPWRTWRPSSSPSLSALLAESVFLSASYLAVFSAAFILPLSDGFAVFRGFALVGRLLSALAGSLARWSVTKPLSLSISASFTPAFDRPDTDLYGRPAMIFLAVASPTPGSSCRSFSLAVLRSTFSLVLVSAAAAGAARPRRPRSKSQLRPNGTNDSDAIQNRHTILLARNKIIRPSGPAIRRRESVCVRFLSLNLGNCKVNSLRQFSAAFWANSPVLAAVRPTIAPLGLRPSES